MATEQREQLAEANIVWDYVACFPANADWHDDPPFLDFSGAPVVSVVDEFEQWLEGTAQMRGVDNR